MTDRWRTDPTTGRRVNADLWMGMPEGERYPYPPGRICVYCANPLSRYNPGPDCACCEPRAALEAAA